MERNTFFGLCREMSPDMVVLFNPSEDLVDEASAILRECTIIVATPRNPPARLLVTRNMVYRRISEVPSPGIGMLNRVKNFFTAAMGEGLIKQHQRVICYSESSIGLFMDVNSSDLGIPALAEKLGSRVDLGIIETAMEMATEIAREGKEGQPAGALFMIGDEHRVLANSHQLLRNPVGDRDQNKPNISDERDSKTIKNWSFMDGGLVMDGRGDVLSAGRYVKVGDIPVSLEEGLGGRHLAAAYISKVSRAVAIVVSQSRVVSVFKDGEVVYRVKSV
ncbi:MAG: diadenylate cyclase [Candidatus Thermoplasmatota archaeon]|nr:diadenylate cyclase [Candidatus Thermoplasmatota archaeon]